jgi:hypothetical protein
MVYDNILNHGDSLYIIYCTEELTAIYTSYMESFHQFKIPHTLWDWTYYQREASDLGEATITPQLRQH